MKQWKQLWETARQSVQFLLVAIVVIAAIVGVSYAAERWLARKKKQKYMGLTIKKMAAVGMFAAVAAILMLFEVALPFLPPFYKIDLSEVPVLICAFAFGPVAGVLAEVIKILLNLLFDGTTTVFVGEFANLTVGCSFIVPAAIVYQYRRTRAGAVFAVSLGTLLMTVFGSVFNAVYLLPAFSRLYGIPLEGLIAMGTKVNPAITDLTTFVFMAVVPLNLLKGVVVSLVVLFLYKPISRILNQIVSA